MALEAYPAGFPSDVVPLLLQFAKGQVPTGGYAVHVAYETIGYALGQILPDPPIQNACPCDPNKTYSIEECCKVLEEHAGQRLGRQAINWLSVLSIVMRLLEGILGNTLTPDEPTPADPAPAGQAPASSAT